MKLKNHNKIRDHKQLRNIQDQLASFEDDILPYLPSKAIILLRARQRQLNKKALTKTILSVAIISITLFYDDPIQQLVL